MRWFSVFFASGLSALAPSAQAVDVELVESFPAETSLDNPDLREAHEVWIEMIERAQTSLDFAHFYASNHPGSRLEGVIVAVETAADRGVRVRFLASHGFYETYPETLDRLGAREGIEVRLYDTDRHMGGVLHAKMMIVDDREAFVGSQNFDWRALTHIQELGVRVAVPEVVTAWADVFALDWILASDQADIARPRRRISAGSFPVLAQAEGGTVQLTPVASPTQWLPDENLWDLPRMVGLIDGAERTVRVQLLTYRAASRRGGYFADLENALRSAAARGVQVELLVADWGKRRGTIEGLQSLQPLPNLTVKMITIPEASDGFVPFARVIHSKFLVVDGARAWIGTSNWSRDYFHAGRNVGLIMEGEALAGRLDRYFTNGFESEYAYVVDPSATYEAPRRQ